MYPVGSPEGRSDPVPHSVCACGCALAGSLPKLWNLSLICFSQVARSTRVVVESRVATRGNSTCVAPPGECTSASTTSISPLYEADLESFWWSRFRRPHTVPDQLESNDIDRTTKQPMSAGKDFLRSASCEYTFGNITLDKISFWSLVDKQRGLQIREGCDECEKCVRS